MKSFLNQLWRSAFTVKHSGTHFKVTCVNHFALSRFWACPYAFSVPPSIEGGLDNPTERKVVVSKPLTLECEAGGHPPPALTWLKDGVPVKSSESVKVLLGGRKIEILNAAVSDSGRYVCVATSIAGEKEIKYDVRVLGISSASTSLLCPLLNLPWTVCTGSVMFICFSAFTLSKVCYFSIPKMFWLSAFCLVKIHFVLM